MKTVMLSMLALLLLPAISQAQVKQNTNKKGVLINGYDPVAYFDNEVKKGSATYQTKYQHATIYFSSRKNLEKFQVNPEKYFPKYGGWCAYAMGLDGSYVEINPNTYEIRDGHLYLFYNKLLTNTKDLWLKEDPVKLKKQADKNWQNLRSK